jgi:hypothetical protein
MSALEITLAAVGSALLAAYLVAGHFDELVFAIYAGFFAA